ncbi:MAG TPA: hypothetical protein VI488_22075 [Candidatus Angelobacter sp.]
MNFAVRVLFLAACLVAAQSPAPPSAEQTAQTDLAAVVKQQFGGSFALKAKFPTPVIVADFDGDGVEDAAIVATSAEPFPDSFDFKYKVIDPYNAYFGFGNPNLTAAFGTVDPSRNHDLLIIFGSGKEGWHAAVPKAKYVMINVPFDEIAVGRMLIKKAKPPIFVIRAREYQLMDSAVWWDAKKQRWRWQPGDTVP